MSVQKVNQTTGATTPIAGVPAATINGIRDNINKNGSKNLMPITAAIASSTVYGVTFTVYSDGHIRVNGTANNPGDTGVNFIYSVHNTELNLPKGRYTFSCAGLPNNNTFQSVIDVADASEAYVKRIAYIASSSLTTFDIDYADYKYIYAFLHVANGTTVSNVDVYPMLRLASDPDDTYVPYAMTNRELTDASVTVVALNSTYVNTGTMWYAKRGKQVILNVDNLSITSSATQSTALNSDKLPKPITNGNYHTRACGWTSKSGNGGVALLEISSVGNFTLGGYLPTALTESCYGQLTYFTNE